MLNTTELQLVTEHFNTTIIEPVLGNVAGYLVEMPGGGYNFYSVEKLKSIAALKFVTALLKKGE